MNGPSPGETRAAVLTGSGRGAIGVVRIWGPSALAIVSEQFRPIRGASLADGTAGRPRFGRFGAGDEVVAMVLEGDPPAVEIHGHGGEAALAMILADLEDRGVRVAPGGIEPGSIAGQAEADLARAETLRAASILLDQLDGALERELVALRRLGDGPEGQALASELLDRARVGLRLVSGWKVVLTGRPNVGKSRLLNAIAGFDRAIVSPTAGTTRDVVEARAAIDGWPVDLADTAGLRRGAAGLEALGNDLTRESLSRADLVVHVLDRSEPLTVEDRAIMGTYPHALRVANKSDLAASWCEGDVDARPVSAVTGDGVDGLLSAISTRLVPRPPPEGSGVPFRPEHVAMIEATVEDRGPGVT